MKQLFATLVFSFAVTSTLRSECVAVSVEQQFDIAAAVFVGRAIAQEVIPYPADQSGALQTETTFAVEDVWKGASDPTVRVRTCGWTVEGRKLVCPDDGIEFAVGERYLVFAFGDPLRAHGCSDPSLVDPTGTSHFLAGKPHKKVR